MSRDKAWEERVRHAETNAGVYDEEPHADLTIPDRVEELE